MSLYVCKCFRFHQLNWLWFNFPGTVSGWFIAFKDSCQKVFVGTKHVPTANQLFFNTSPRWPKWVPQLAFLRHFQHADSCFWITICQHWSLSEDFEAWELRFGSCLLNCSSSHMRQSGVTHARRRAKYTYVCTGVCVCARLCSPHTLLKCICQMLLYLYNLRHSHVLPWFPCFSIECFCMFWCLC